ncbi:hypothetical protein CEXT_538861 [Caerostris extrusa]|uniref:Uncharacterized protein n=1 Tax=Caerostris extrusa TaxID=172846 RepID=A0AAV4VP86_CAEEX|nr:hypothetical protein CEXT_538861 [Caerostris extrusa]
MGRDVRDSVNLFLHDTQCSTRCHAHPHLWRVTCESSFVTPHPPKAFIGLIEQFALLSSSRLGSMSENDAHRQNATSLHPTRGEDKLSTD